MCVYQAGDVIRYVSDVDDNDKYYREPVWVLALDEDGTKVAVLSGRFRSGHDLIVTIGRSSHEQPGRQVVPPEEWPDEIGVLVARFKLTGEL